ncbi:hypothetical protein [Micromonospora sp. NPDC048839]|uniref:hypothetical protein n=1 Tax=Micromonospora sp. NPDC048839 TaxID=3155641 RepID=UPI0033D930DB
MTNVWQMPDGIYQHVLIASGTPNVYMALVLDLRTAAVLGHHLLDLNELYGLSQAPVTP